MADTFPTALSLAVVERLQEAKKKKSVTSLLTPQTWLLETKEAVVRKLSLSRSNWAQNLSLLWSCVMPS